MMDWRWRLFCTKAAYCHMFERKNFETYYFDCALTKRKKYICSRRLFAMARERGQKSQVFFSKQHYVAGLSL